MKQVYDMSWIRLRGTDTALTMQPVIANGVQRSSPRINRAGAVMPRRTFRDIAWPRA